MNITPVTKARALRLGMMFSGIGIAVAAAAIPALQDGQVALFPMASALFFWALRGPGHVDAAN
jgi:hypothetical protein